MIHKLFENIPRVLDLPVFNAPEAFPNIPKVLEGEVPPPVEEPPASTP